MSRVTVSLLVVMLWVASDAAAQLKDQAQRSPQLASGCAHGTLGPLLDPIVGDRIGRDELSCLPSGRHLGAVFDVWFNRVINQQVSGGGMAFFDPLRLSSYGHSWRQTRFHLNSVEVTDPARPGEPLFELPYAVWDGLTYQSLWTARPRVDQDFRAETATSWSLTGAAGRDWADPSS